MKIVKNKKIKKTSGIVSSKLLLPVGVFIVIFLVALFWITTKEKPEFSLRQFSHKVEPISLPGDLKIPLVQNGKTLKSEKTESGKQEIIFYSYAAPDAVVSFYKEWASYNEFEFSLNESRNNEERIDFSLIPAFGTTGLADYFFVIEPNENGTQVFLSYFSKTSPNSNTKKPEENNTEKISIPKDFKIKF